MDRVDGLLAQLERLAVEDGITKTSLPNLTLFRSSKPAGPFAVEYRPGLCVVAQGRKRVTVGDRSFDYNPESYLVAGLPLPVSTQIVEASLARPFLSLVLDIDLIEVGQLLLSMPPRAANAASPAALQVSQMKAPLYDAVVRLLQAVQDTTECCILGPGLIREILFRVLSGEQSALLRTMALRDGRALRVGQAITFIQDHVDEPIDVATIAKSVGVSVSTLHHIFKDTTGLSPIQYIKEMRLHRARLLMVAEGLGAGEAAYRVGYGSQSQFSREFKRLFGLSPSHAVRKKQLAIR